MGILLTFVFPTGLFLCPNPQVFLPHGLQVHGTGGVIFLVSIFDAPGTVYIPKLYLIFHFDDLVSSDICHLHIIDVFSAGDKQIHCKQQRCNHRQ